MCLGSAITVFRRLAAPLTESTTGVTPGTVHHPIYWGPIGPCSGGSGYWNFIQTIGQGLGLTPPFGTDQLANEPLFPGVKNAGDLGDVGYNQMIYTTLAPDRGQYLLSGSTSFGYPATPMAFDIAAIQFLYGPNTTFHSGSDGYGLPDENAPGANRQCIWNRRDQHHRL